jgi:hypothetical protein
VEESNFCLFLVFFPARCISSISLRFYFRKHTFCFLPLATILEFPKKNYLKIRDSHWAFPSSLLFDRRSLSWSFFTLHWFLTTIQFHISNEFERTDFLKNLKKCSLGWKYKIDECSELSQKYFIFVLYFPFHVIYHILFLLELYKVVKEVTFIFLYRKN